MNYDLFDTATVTLDDVELWLKAVPRFTDETAPNRLLSYAVDYDVVNKIRTAKVNKSFYQLHVIDKQNLSRSIKPLIKPKYKPCTFHPLGGQTKQKRPRNGGLFFIAYNFND